MNVWKELTDDDDKNDEKEQECKKVRRRNDKELIQVCICY